MFSSKISLQNLLWKNSAFAIWWFQALSVKGIISEWIQNIANSQRVVAQALVIAISVCFNIFHKSFWEIKSKVLTLSYFSKLFLKCVFFSHKITVKSTKSSLGMTFKTFSKIRVEPWLQAITITFKNIFSSTFIFLIPVKISGFKICPVKICFWLFISSVFSFGKV